ncbi:Sodium transport ATPase 2 [Tolypocladium capitatum]|uniref:Sodium transport ATPase 2 n=1 Tax=Tolypocladium capitatum TaxID=45235 RepID=A0A2K3QN57_9HYPO|nr:Sodium transport ATPase 2 [Tolypocladium capitatum]
MHDIAAQGQGETSVPSPSPTRRRLPPARQCPSEESVCRILGFGTPTHSLFNHPLSSASPCPALSWLSGMVFINHDVSEQFNVPMTAPAHALKIYHVVEQLKADVEVGLSAKEAERHLEDNGRNELSKQNGVQPVKIFIGQIANALTLAIRNGNNDTVVTAEIVPGDMAELKTGDTIPADICLVEAVDFETNEALLTGESLPVRKEAVPTYDADTCPGDRLNVAYSSSTVTKGRARGVVFATGLYTEIGQIAAALRGKGSRRR